MVRFCRIFRVVFLLLKFLGRLSASKLRFVVLLQRRAKNTPHQNTNTHIGNGKDRSTWTINRPFRFTDLVREPHFVLAAG